MAATAVLSLTLPPLPSFTVGSLPLASGVPASSATSATAAGRMMRRVGGRRRGCAGEGCSVAEMEDMAAPTAAAVADERREKCGVAELVLRGSFAYGRPDAAASAARGPRGGGAGTDALPAAATAAATSAVTAATGAPHEFARAPTAACARASSAALALAAPPTAISVVEAVVPPWGRLPLPVPLPAGFGDATPFTSPSGPPVALLPPNAAMAAATRLLVAPPDASMGMERMLLAVENDLPEAPTPDKFLFARKDMRRLGGRLPLLLAMLPPLMCACVQAAGHASRRRNLDTAPHELL